MRVNQRRSGSVYDSETRRYEPQWVIRKKAEGKFGQAGYRMSSIVWRWNHPNNSRRQIETRGYPNERLWNDLQIFYITQQQYKNEIAALDANRNARLESLRQQDAEREAEQQRRQEEYRLSQARREKEMIARRASEAELEGIQEQQRIANLMKTRVDAEVAESTFSDMCEYYDVPVFTRDNGANDWERRFLTDLIVRMGQGKNLSVSQLSHLRKIVVDEPLPITDKQRWYLKKLDEGVTIPDDMNRVEASHLITLLKERNTKREEE